ncbi:MAG: potassium transporter TrkG [Candidatus Thermoplasmatota archaeon]|nr:potassium transporter TrkG [Candidatus Thermoplasmatota archaeon]
MRSDGIWVGLTRINMLMLLLLSISFMVDILYGDLGISNVLVFTVPFIAGLVLYMVQFIILGGKMKRLTKRARYKTAMGSFLYIVILGALPFLLSGKMGLFTALFESMAGFTTTGLSSFDPSDMLDVSRGLLFFRVAIQWMGGLFYLIFAFMFLSDLSDVAKRSADRKLFAGIGLVPRLTNLIQSLTLIYGLFTVAAILAFSISGMGIFDSVCLSLGTVSTGGFTSTGRIIQEGVGIHMIVLVLMFFAGMGYYVHMSIFSARGRRKTIFDTENIAYVTITLTFPIAVFLILVMDGMPFLDSVWNGAFSAISALTTTGFMVEGSGNWPDSYKFLMLILMMIGGSTLSLASGFKVQRVILLIRGFFGEVKRASHPRAMITIKRGEGTYSEKALESANMSFFYLFGLLAFTICFILVFHEGLFDVISLSVTSVTNAGLAFGPFAGPDGINSLNWAVKSLLFLTMFLGRFEILVPIYFLSPGSYRFTG